MYIRPIQPPIKNNRWNLTDKEKIVRKKHNHWNKSRKNNNFISPFSNKTYNHWVQRRVHYTQETNQGIIQTQEKHNLKYIEDIIEDEDVEEMEEDKKELVYLDKPTSIKDLISIAKKYDEDFYDKNKRYNMDISIIHKLEKPLTKLDSMVGLSNIKKQIFHLLIYYLQKLENKNKDLLHTVLEGPPGVGKTEVAKILAEIYGKMGVLSKGTFHSVKRSDLIGGFLGQTAIKTEKLLKKCIGGVLFIDEAYSLGNKEGKDMYSKECIDTLTAFLTEHSNNFICIIAGYKDSLEQCFFSYNRGLERRFPYRFSLKGYSPKELQQIFIKKVNGNDWSIEQNKKLDHFFVKNKDYFTNYGGDMDILFHKCKITHALRVLGEPIEARKKIIYTDIQKAFKLLLQNENIKKRNEKKFLSMYT